MTRPLPILLSLAALLASSSALAGERPLVGVLDLNGSGAKLSRDEVLDLTGLVRKKALDLLGDRYDIITRENLEDLLKASGKTLAKCLDGACETEIGRNIGAELIVSGSVRKTFGKLSIELKLHSTDPPRVLGIETTRVKRKSELPEATMKLAMTLFSAEFRGSPSGGNGKKREGSEKKRQSALVDLTKKREGSEKKRQSALVGLTATIITAGVHHTCALDSQGRAVCWGRNNDGQSKPPKGSFTAIAAGYFHTCTLDSQGKAVCWGRNKYGQSTPPKGSFTAINAGVDRTCALDSQGRAVCWGLTMSSRASPNGSFAAIAAGYYHTCALDSQGRAVCWGQDDNGQSSPPAGAFTTIAAGAFHSCALGAQGQAVCWGSNEFGQSRLPKGSFTAIAAGGFHTCALSAQGQAVCWGSNEFGQSRPPKGSFTAIAAGYYHTCALDFQGRAVCWGHNDDGQSTPPTFRAH